MKYFIVFSSILLMFAFLLGCSERGINQASFQGIEQMQGTENNLGTIEKDSEGPSFNAVLYPVKPNIKREKKGEAFFKFDDKFANLEFKLTVNDLSEVISAYLFIGDNYNSDITPIIELFPAKRVTATRTDPSSAIVAQGILTSKDLLYQLRGKNLETLHQLMAEGKTFVSVSTDQYSIGEIIGTIRSGEID